MKTLGFNILLFLSYSLFINTIIFASPFDKNNFNLNTYEYSSLDYKIDSTEVVNDTLNEKKSFLLDKVIYTATDSVSINPNVKSIHLYNNAKIVYESMEITSGIIVIDYGTNEIYAGRIKDSLGNYTQSPVFTQGQ